ncbi:MAG: hypothetical protein CVU95_14625 [Firmicutes bacterium HGW-Firmicutes-2]|jgi:hypothetical protein|nr:MAG: hypothetical protein CVU95_14625 [Firmicutes bacterium HGW-Firmicutes-2]
MKYKIILAAVIVITLTSVTMYAVSQNQLKIEKMKEAIQLEEENRTITSALISGNCPTCIPIKLRNKSSLSYRKMYIELR